MGITKEMSFNELNTSNWLKTLQGDKVKLDEGLINKETIITLKEKEGLIDGVIRKIEGKNIVVSKYGNWDKKEIYHIDEIDKIKVSEFPYYSLEHKRTLRLQEIPRHTFRYTHCELRDLLGKYAFVNYDGKIIDGKIVNISFKDRDGTHNTITVRPIGSTNEDKTIEDFRLRELEITGDTEGKHLMKHEFNRIEMELYTKSENEYSHCHLDMDLESDVDPDNLLEKLFEAKINGLKGEFFAPEKFVYSWTQEVLEKENELTSEELAKKISIARNNNEYYECKQEFLEEIFKYVSKVNWSAFGISQLEGEIKALEHIYDSGVLVS